MQKKKKIKNIYLSSNMEFFNEKLIDQIFENKLQGTLKFVIASLDGVSETVHQSNRIGVDTKKAYENTELLLNKRKENFSFYPWVFPRMLIKSTVLPVGLQSLSSAEFHSKRMFRRGVYLLFWK